MASPSPVTSGGAGSTSPARASLWRLLRDDVSTPTRWPALDGVRGVALAGVVVYHAIRFLIEDGNPQLDWRLWTFMGTARLGLDAFFVLSGILVVDSWRSIRRRTPRFGPALAEFWRRRARRILPAYWLSLLVLVPLLAPELLAPGGWSRLGLFVTVQADVIDHLPDQVNTPYWSLTTEFHFYVLVPLVAWMIAGRRRWAAVAATVAFSAAWWAGLRGDMAASFILGRLDQFLIGAIAGDAVRRAAAGSPSRVVKLLSRPRAGRLLLTALLGAGTWHGSRLWNTPSTLPDHLLHPVVGLILAGLFVHLLCAPPRVVFTHPLPRFLGLVSYSVYLWHYPLQRHGLAWLGVGEPGTPPAAVALAATAVVTLSVAVGVACYLVAERPFLRRHRRVGTPVPEPPEAALARTG